MVSTRSASKQSHIKDFTDDASKKDRNASKTTKKGTASKTTEKGTGSSTAKGKAAKQKPLQDSVQDVSVATETKSKIRKEPPASGEASSPPSKRKKPSSDQKQQQQHFSSTNASSLSKPIMINRSPVLQLWGAVVTQFLHPEIPWPGCLSAGNAIASLCAVSKGRSIGVIETKDKDDSEIKEKRERKEKAEEGTKVIQVMGFPLHLKNDTVLVSGQSKTLNEKTLKNKYGAEDGEEQYERVKKTMTEALESWKADKEELNRKAFHMYEKFRPNVAGGQKGWGRKGELNLHEVDSVIRR